MGLYFCTETLDFMSGSDRLVKEGSLLVSNFLVNASFGQTTNPFCSTFHGRHCEDLWSLLKRILVFPNHFETYLNTAIDQEEKETRDWERKNPIDEALEFNISRSDSVNSRTMFIWTSNTYIPNHKWRTVRSNSSSKEWGLD